MRPVLAAAIAVGAATVGVGPALAQDVDGIWLTEGGQSRVRITPCGTARCGVIVATQREASDSRNPDPALRSRPIVGVQLISDARREGEAWAGRLYNPLDGRTYAGRMRLLSPDRLELSGCVLAGLICQAQVWTRLR